MLRFLLRAMRQTIPAAPLEQRVTVEQRRHVRYSGPALILTIEGHRYKTRDWSLGGFRVARFHRPIVPGTPVRGVIGVTGSAAVGEFVAEIVHGSNDTGVGLRILEIAPAIFVAMTRLKAH